MVEKWFYIFDVIHVADLKNIQKRKENKEFEDKSETTEVSVKRMIFVLFCCCLFVFNPSMLKILMKKKNIGRHHHAHRMQ